MTVLKSTFLVAFATIAGFCGDGTYTTLGSPGRGITLGGVLPSPNPCVTGSLFNVSFATPVPGAVIEDPPPPPCAGEVEPDDGAPTGSSRLGIHLFLPGCNHLSLGSLL